MSDTDPNTTSTASVPISGFGEMVQIDGSAIDKLAQLGADATGVTIVDVQFDEAGTGLPSHFPIAVIHGEKPSLASIKALAEEWRTAPLARAGTARTLTLDSFIELVNRHKIMASAVFANTDWTKPSLTAVIDYHPEADAKANDAANGRHRVQYAFPLSEEWKAWIAADGQWMDQADLAEFIEEHVHELRAPQDGTRIWMERDLQTTVGTPAQIITLARGLEVNVGQKVKQVRNLQTGEAQIVFNEEHTGADGQPIRVPGGFAVEVAPFFMGDSVEVPVRLRYRANGGVIKWMFKIFRPDTLINEAVRQAMADVRDHTTLPVYEGAPEMEASGAPVRALGGC
jgi:uncharacterized protein YfdQ (DUF2303 family)